MESNNSTALALQDARLEEFNRRMQELRDILQHKPGKKDVKQAPSGKPHIPVSIIEDKLDKIFNGLWQVKELKFQTIFNEIACTLEVHVKHPVTGEWICRAGAGAAQIRCSKLSDDQLAANQAAIRAGIPIPYPPIDASRKIQNGIEMDFPKAKSAAFKNACLSLGKFFGRDLRRKDGEVGYYHENEMRERSALADAITTVMQAPTLEDLSNIEKALSVKWNNSVEFAKACNARKAEIEADYEAELNRVNGGES